MAKRAQSIADLDVMTAPEFREEWRRVHRNAPPRLPVDLMRLALAYELQRKREGGLSRGVKAQLRRTPPADASALLLTLKPGACLVREWHGKTHSVAVTDGAYLYEGKSYRSLSAIAYEITGTKWSGPRFFGVRGS
jgi:Protein of unknown function (DUF2924)